MSFLRFFRALKMSRRDRRANANPQFTPRLHNLESRITPNGYMAVGAGPGSYPLVAIRVDIQDQIGGNNINQLATAPAPRADGRTDFTSQVFMPFMSGFRGGVHVATGNFDGRSSTPDQLVTAAGAGGGPHVIIWNTVQAADGKVTVTGIQDEFFAFDARFRGGVNVTTGDFDGDGRADLVCAAGAGGGPHVKIYSMNSSGHFQLVNEFFAYDASFRGGVSVASNQGYSRVSQVRQVLSDQLPDNFVPVPYAGVSSPEPGSPLNIPLIDSIYYGGTGDYPLQDGDSTFIQLPGGGGTYIAPNGNPGSLDSDNVPLPYVTIASGKIQYFSANPLNGFGNTVYRPNIFVPPQTANPDEVGQIFFASWGADSPNLPAGFLPDVVYGPFVKLASIQTPDGPIERITRFTQDPGNAVSKSVLVTGAGPGGGPHVRVWDFTSANNKATNNGVNTLINNGVGNEFFAFDASFRGGVNVAINDFMSHNEPTTLGGQPAVAPGRFDYTGTQRQFVFDSTANSSIDDAFALGSPFSTELYRSYAPEIMVSMASQGNTVRIFADYNPAVADPNNPASSPAPQQRTSLSQVQYVAAVTDAIQTVSPFPFSVGGSNGGFVGTSLTADFNRGQSTVLNGGISIAATTFRFEGTANPFLYGADVLTGQAKFSANPVLAQAAFTGGFGGGSQGGRVRIFNQMSAFQPFNLNYQAADDFDAFFGNNLINGASIASGFGPLAEQDGTNMDIIVMPTQISVSTVTDPILVTF